MGFRPKGCIPVPRRSPEYNHSPWSRHFGVMRWLTQNDAYLLAEEEMGGAFGWFEFMGGGLLMAKRMAAYFIRHPDGRGYHEAWYPSKYGTP